MNNLLAGAVAGLAATVPMSLAMKLMHSRLPSGQQHPLPPRQIAMNAAKKTGVEKHISDEAQRHRVTLLAHFAFGATAGAFYIPLVSRFESSPVIKGVGYGLGVWAVNYLSLLPAAELVGPAANRSAQRNAIMIAAHVVWGASLGVTIDYFQAERTPVRA